MYYTPALITQNSYNGRSGHQSVKIGLEEESLVMTQEEKEQSKGLSLRDIDVLKDLIKRCRKGDIVAMEAIYGHFNRPIYNLVYRYTYNREIAEDLLQDIFIKIFTHLQSLQKEEAFVNWLYRIAINTCYSYLRGRRSQIARAIPLNDVEEKIDERPHESEEKIMKKPLDNAIQSLPGKLRTIFLLHDVQGFKHEEIAGVLGCSVGTSKSQLFKARMKIRERLKNKKVL